MEVRCAATYSELFSQPKYSKDKIVNMIEHLELKQSLFVITKFNAIWGAKVRNIMLASEYEYFLKTRYIQCHTDKDLSLLFNREIFYPQQIMITTKWLLAHGIINDSEKIHALHLDEVINVIRLIIAISDYLPGEEVSEHRTEFLYTSQYLNSIKIPKYELARTYKIFVQDETKIMEDKWNKFNKKYGYNIDDFFATIWIFLSLLLLNKNFMKEITLREISECCENLKSYGKVVDSLGMSLEKAKKEALKVIDEVWNYEWMYIKPLLLVDDIAFPYNYISLSYQWFDGLYWKTRVCFPKDNTRFQGDFGKPFEHYIQNISKKCVNEKVEFEFINEFHYRYEGNSRDSSDGYIYSGKNLIIIECKAKTPRSETVKGYNISVINNEIEDMIVCPVHQVDLRYQELIQCNEKFKTIHANIENIFVIIVSMDRIQPSKHLFTFAESYFRYSEKTVFCPDKNKTIQPFIMTEKFYGYYNFSAYDFEKLCGLIETDATIFDFLKEYFLLFSTSKELIVPCFDDFISSKGFGETRFSGIEEDSQEFINKINHHISGKYLNFHED